MAEASHERQRLSRAFLGANENGKTVAWGRPGRQLAAESAEEGVQPPSKCLGVSHVCGRLRHTFLIYLNADKSGVKGEGL